eukprot:10987543-Karenia_brevis.AAC.1
MPTQNKQGSGYGMAMTMAIPMAMAIFITCMLNDSAIKEHGFIIHCTQSEHAHAHFFDAVHKSNASRWPRRPRRSN